MGLISLGREIITWVREHYEFTCSSEAEELCGWKSMKHINMRVQQKSALMFIHAGEHRTHTQRAVKKGNASYCFNIACWVCIFQTSSLILFTNVSWLPSGTEPSQSAAAASEQLVCTPYFFYDPGLNLPFDIFPPYFQILLCLLCFFVSSIPPKE